MYSTADDTVVMGVFRVVEMWLQKHRDEQGHVWQHLCSEHISAVTQAESIKRTTLQGLISLANMERTNGSLFCPLSWLHSVLVNVTSS